MVVSMLRHRRRHAPTDSPLSIHDVLESTEYRDLMTPKIAEGDVAPDFELSRLGGAGSVRGSALWSMRPVALIFGSYT
jgi:hypothetical protein